MKRSAKISAPNLKKIFVALTVCMVAVISHIAQAQQPPMAVQVDAVMTEPLVQTVPVLGRVVANQRGEVSARVAGPVAKMMVEVGDRVRTGSVIAILDMRRLRLEWDLASAELRTALSELETSEEEMALLQQELQRLERLRNSAAFNRAGLDDKVREISAAASRVEAAKARIDRARANYGFRRADFNDALVRAPYPGVIEITHVSEGTHVAVGEAVVSLVNDTDFEIEADVPVERVTGLVDGLVVDVILDTGEHYPAELRAIIPVENPMTRTRAIRFQPKDEKLAGTAAGQSVTIDIPIGKARDVLSVHKDAVTINQGNRIVYVVDGENIAQPRPIQIGEFNRQQV